MGDSQSKNKISAVDETKILETAVRKTYQEDVRIKTKDIGNQTAISTISTGNQTSTTTIETGNQTAAAATKHSWNQTEPITNVPKKDVFKPKPKYGREGLINLKIKFTLVCR